MTEKNIYNPFEENKQNNIVLIKDNKVTINLENEISSTKNNGNGNYNNDEIGKSNDNSNIDIHIADNYQMEETNKSKEAKNTPEYIY